MSAQARHERATPAELGAAIEVVSSSPIVGALLVAVDAALLVLDSHRQIVAANQRHLFPDAQRSPDAWLGLRPGEALDCIHAKEAPLGCGASDACASCGALRSILRCTSTERPADDECLLTLHRGPSTESLELDVRASPVRIEGRPFTVLSLRDVSGERRRRVLEQVFFHDVLNTVTGLAGWARVLGSPGADAARAVARIGWLTGQIEREIKEQRDLLRAESGALEPMTAPATAAQILASIVDLFASHPTASGRRLVVDPEPADLGLSTDATLVQRVLANMVKNALEATPAGGAVRIWCEAPADPGGAHACAFHVHNDAVLDERVARRVFQRSFSTKASSGRGLGTYSMKLFGERCLGGEVSFTSRAGEGTVFTLRLPRGDERGASS
jgi:hypothetical protein